MPKEKRLIDANGSYTLNANDNTGYSICFYGGTVSVFDDFGRCLCECDTEDVPTADAVEVVRCKDCKWYDADCEICVYLSEDGDTYDCGCDVNMKPDDFCSYGERRN